MVVEKLDLERIKFLNDASGVAKIDKGYSGAVKFAFEKDGEKYFLKIGKFGVNYDLEKILTEANIPHPTIVETGWYNKDIGYVIEKYVGGENLKDALSKYDAEEFYDFGLEIGSKYRNLRKVYPDQPVSESLCDEYAKSIDEKIKKLNDLLNLDDTMNLVSRRVMLAVAKFLQNSLCYVKDSLMVYGHTDVKPSNFLLRDGKILATDVEITEYKEITASMIWTFARVDFEDSKNLAFAQGYLAGLFNYNVPAGVWKCCNHNYAYNMVEYFVRYLERKDYEKLGRLLQHIAANYLADGKIIIDKYLREKK